MGSFTRLTYNIVFATQYRRPTIHDSMRKRLYEYIGGTLRNKGGHSIELGGVEDHAHVLARLSPSLDVANVVRDVKANSSRWMNENSKSTLPFQWQKGYAAFTVSYSNIVAAAAPRLNGLCESVLRDHAHSYLLWPLRGPCKSTTEREGIAGFAQECSTWATVWSRAMDGGMRWTPKTGQLDKV